MKLVLHIGTHKTGSTAIQNVLAHNRARLESKGFCYPKLANGQAGHHGVVWAIRAAAGGKTSETPDPTALDRLRRQLKRSDCHTAILSSEEFEFVTTPEQLRVVRKALPAEDVRIVVYLRRQDKYLVSEYGQHLRMYKHRFSGSIHDFYMRYNFSNRFNYLRALTRWAKVFGAENVTVRPFEPCQFENGDLIADARAALGLADVDLDVPRDLPSNKGLSAPACVVLSHANRHDLGVDAHRRLLDHLYRHEEQLAAEPFELLSSRNIVDLLAQYAVSNSEVARTFLARSDGVLFREPVPEAGSYGDAGRPGREPMVDYVVSLLASVVRSG